MKQLPINKNIAPQAKQKKKQPNHSPNVIQLFVEVLLVVESLEGFRAVRKPKKDHDVPAINRLSIVHYIS